MGQSLATWVHVAAALLIALWGLLVAYDALGLNRRVRRQRTAATATRAATAALARAARDYPQGYPGWWTAMSMRTYLCSTDPLLRQVLSAEQAETYRQTGSVPVQAASGRLYCVHHGRTFNVDEIGPQGQVLVHRCLVTPGTVSVQAQMAAQIILLQSDEETFRRLANRSRDMGRWP